ncbi:hypothetical protein PDIDSM_2214 [Penicillium digitatum]|nr:hypothetical protein PDIDSM_2214 [Penicillium digitatum]
MEQIQVQLHQNPVIHLDVTAKEFTAALAHVNCRHGFIGGYAASLIGGERRKDDMDLIVDAEPANVRQMLLQVSGFQLTSVNHLGFTYNDKLIKVGVLRGGRAQSMKLPDANSIRP